MKYNTHIFKITFTGIMLALVIIFQFLERYMVLVPFIFNINLSIIFILLTTFVAGFSYSLILQLLRWAIGPALSTGYNTMNLYGMTISFLVIFIFTSLAFIAYKSKILHSKQPIIISMGLITIFTSLLITVFNGLFILDGWAKVLNISIHNNRDGISKIWGINSYWGAVFAVFLTGNLINLGIATFVFVISYKPLKSFLATKR